VEKLLPAARSSAPLDSGVRGRGRRTSATAPPGHSHHRQSTGAPTGERHGAGDDGEEIAKKFFVDDVDPAEAVRCGGEAGGTGSAIRTSTNDHHARQTPTKKKDNDMTATYTFDIFSSLDGHGSHSGDWGGYWGKQGPELLDHRLALYGPEQRMVFGANTYRQFVRLLGSSTAGSGAGDPWVTRMISLPATVVSTTLEEPLDWPNATVVSGDAVDVVARLKEESEVPLRSHGSLSLNWALMAAALVDRVQVTIFPVITGQTGLEPIFQGAADFDLELVESRTLDGHTQELIYRPTLH